MTMAAQDRANVPLPYYFEYCKDDTVHNCISLCLNFTLAKALLTAFCLIARSFPCQHWNMIRGKGSLCVALGEMEGHVKKTIIMLCGIIINLCRVHIIIINQSLCEFFGKLFAVLLKNMKIF